MMVVPHFFDSCVVGASTSRGPQWWLWVVHRNVPCPDQDQDQLFYLYRDPLPEDASSLARALGSVAFSQGSVGGLRYLRTSTLDY